jgi:hypothetical protein
MSKYIAKYRENDSHVGEEVFLAIEGTEYGFVAVPDNGDELDLCPSDTVEEAMEEMEYYFADFDTFELLDD